MAKVLDQMGMIKSSSEISGNEKSSVVPRKADSEIGKKFLESSLSDAGVGRRYWDSDVKSCRCRDQMKRYLKNMQENVETGKGVLCYGPFGTGKSSVLVAIAKAYMWEFRERFYLDGFEISPTRGIGVQYVTANELAGAAFRKEHDLIRTCKNGDILVVDDFGRAYQTEFVHTQMFEILDRRYANQKITLIATNLTPEELQKAFPGLVERWKEACELFELGGKSMR